MYILFFKEDSLYKINAFMSMNNKINYFKFLVIIFREQKVNKENPGLMALLDLQ